MTVEMVPYEFQRGGNKDDENRFGEGQFDVRFVAMNQVKVSRAQFEGTARPVLTFDMDFDSGHRTPATLPFDKLQITQCGCGSGVQCPDPRDHLRQLQRALGPYRHNSAADNGACQFLRD